MIEVMEIASCALRAPGQRSSPGHPNTSNTLSGGFALDYNDLFPA
jgi:hypothetical protein